MAVTAAPLRIKTCKNGHPLVGDNLILSKDKRDGKTRSLCRLCRNEQALRSGRRRRAERSEQNARTCPKGHKIFGSNAARIVTKNGRVYYACKTCRREAVARVRARQKNGQPPKPEPEFRTDEVWRMLPQELRQQVAAVLMDRQPADPLVAAVIRRAARKRAWVRLGATFAVVALVEGLIEECRESTSPRLRLDKVLARIL